LPLKVYIGQDDPGFQAQNTALDQEAFRAVQAIPGKDASGVNAIMIPKVEDINEKREMGKALSSKYMTEHKKYVRDKQHSYHDNDSNKLPITSFLDKLLTENLLLSDAEQAFLKKIEQYRRGGGKGGDIMSDSYTGNKNVWVALWQITQYLQRVGVPGIYVVK
jgi:hypothetical protein